MRRGTNQSWDDLAQKVSKKSPERSLGTPDPGPLKSPRNIVKINSFLDFFSELFFGTLTFWGFGVGGSQTALGRLFETFLRFQGFGPVNGRRDPKTRGGERPLWGGPNSAQLPSPPLHTVVAHVMSELSSFEPTDLCTGKINWNSREKL